MALGGLVKDCLALRLKGGHRLMILPMLLIWGFSLLLGGCFQSDLTLHFDHHNRGVMMQSIRLDQGIRLFANPTLEAWLTALKQQIGDLGGSFTQTPDQINLAVPFSTAADLEQEFSQTWAALAAIDPLALAGLNPLPVSLRIQQSYWLLASRNHLICDFDLQSLKDLGGLHQPERGQDWASFSLRVATPWGSRVLGSSPQPLATSQSREVHWQLQTGAVNHLDVVFWLPDVVGIGTLIIALVVVFGYFLRYRLLAAATTLKNSGKALV